MAHIFKHKESDKLYTIEYLKKDIIFVLYLTKDYEKYTIDEFSK